VPADEPLGDFAVLKLHGNDEDRAFGLLLGHFQRAAKFPLHVAFLGNRAFGKADDDSVGATHGLPDFEVPIVAGQEPLLVEPRFKPVLAKAALHLAHDSLVLRGVTEKHSESICDRIRHEHSFANILLRSRLGGNGFVADWTVLKYVKAHLRVLVKHILRKHSYPPDKQEKNLRVKLELDLDLDYETAGLFRNGLRGEISSKQWTELRSDRNGRNLR